MASAIGAAGGGAAASGSAASAGGAGGGGPLYQVAAVDQGLNLEPETLSFWGYDDGSAVLLVVKGGLVFAYDMAPPPPPHQAAAGLQGLGGPPGGPDQLKWTFPLADGPPVRRMRLSLDGGLLALQRGGRLLELVELATGNVFVQGTDKSDLITFFFTELPGAEVVLVAPGGLEMYEFVGARRQGLRLKERIRMPVEWAIYTHETRMVLLGTATGGVSYIKAFQFVSTGLVVLPPFTAGAAASALALMGVPSAAGTAAGIGPAGGVSVTGLGLGLVSDIGGGGLVGVGSAAVAAVGGLAASPAAAAAVATPPVRVPPENLRLIKVYGRVYCVHINRRSLKLELYRFYTDTVVLQYTYELFSPHVDVAVVDSVIVVVAQQPPAGSSAAAAAGSSAASGSGFSGGLGVAMLYDVAAHTGQPVANPLPVRLLRFYSGPGAPPEAAAPAGDAHGSHRFDFLAPSVILDRTAQTVYRLALNLPAVVESCSDAAVLAGFLQRRRGGPTPAMALAAPPPGGAPPPGSEVAAALAAALAAVQPKALLLGVVRNALQERMPMATVRAIFDDLCAGYAAALDRELLAAALAPPPLPPPPPAAAPAAAGGSAAAAQPPGGGSSAAAAAAGAAGGGSAGGAAALPLPPLPPPAPGSVPMPAYVTPEELATQLFRWLHDEEVVDAPYLQAALSEYMAAAVGAGIPLPAYLQGLSVEVMMQQQQLLQPHLQAGHVLQLLYSQAQYVAPEVVQKVVAALSATAAATATADGGEGAELEPAGVADRAAGAAATGSSSGSSSAAAAGTSAVARMARQLELDELGRTALAARYESPVAPHVPYYHSPVTAAAAARSGPAAAFGAAATPGGGGGDAAAYVAALLAGGDVLRAARVMKRYRVSKPTVREFVTAVGARGDAVALAAVYRVFQDELLSAFPKYELAARTLLPPGAAAAVGIVPPPDRPAAAAAAGSAAAVARA
ncbi:hypothetical protein CHLRE_08g370250v5 [Chlamydomonas reinhardtii]|uniref:Regulator of MON1-CCZ1 complex N-terminal domain-containing protein n=1 Tax=Chlamydomonas reinhardtii TaxID=3055 RepID=A0A2K3DH62_CHLRE|nr:uncharacterized protein CHLRE_08g370250v5 [Chlamydomonas reinhardtii]PNW79878.1 hypothetical protein CHLRE_08g370250v5 [Chlamydomonas reinhardtii]